MIPAQLRDVIREIKTLTDKPFNINLFVPELSDTCTTEEIKKFNSLYDKYRRKLNIPESPAITLTAAPNFSEQLTVIIEEKVPVFSFTFGVLPQNIIQQLKKQNIISIGTATTVREAIQLEQSGVDMIVAQGSEAGGHRGSAHDTNIDNALIGSMALIPQVADHVNVPVIASGGIMDSRGIAAALMLGASAAQMGTAFLTCPESSINSLHRTALLNSTDESTRLTKAFTGKTARSIQNKLLLEMAQQKPTLPFHTHRAALRDIQQAAIQQNNSELISLWSGQAASLCRSKPAAKLIKELVSEIEKLLAK
jgi:nitronate monooxygenase